MEILYYLSMLTVLFYEIELIQGDSCQPIVTSLQRYGQVYTHNSICYVFLNHEKTWVDARHQCESWGGDMVHIPDAGTMNFIKDVMDNQLHWSNNGVWIGLHNRGSGGWKWTTGNGQTYSYWDSGQPSRTFGFISFEDCACMRRGDRWKWHDYMCDNRMFTYKYICQFHSSIGIQVASNIEISQQGKESHGLSDTSKGAIIGLVLGGFVVLVIVGMIFILFRRRRRKKRESDNLVVQFENTDYMRGYTQGYTPVSQGEGHEATSRPESHMYMDTNEMNRLYEQVTKEVDHGVNRYDQLKPKGAEASNRLDNGEDSCDLKKQKVELPEEESAAKLNNENEYVDMGANKPKLTNLEANTRRLEKQNNLKEGEPVYTNGNFRRDRLPTPSEDELAILDQEESNSLDNGQLEVLDYEECPTTEKKTDPLYDFVH